MVRIITLFIMLFIGFTVTAQSINLKGTVSNKSGDPIRNAVVTLEGQKLSDTTDNSGAYSITRNTLAISRNHDLNRPISYKISIQKGILWIILPRASSMMIELFNINGKLLGGITNKSISSGYYAFNIQKHLTTINMVIIRITVEGNTRIFRYSPLQNSTFVLQSSATASTTPSALKMNGSSLDILKVSADNYKTKEESISSYEGVVNITLDSINLPLFSFFVTSLKALQELSGSEKGFGGDLRFGETGPGAGLRGADKICECIAEKSMPGSKVKQWRAFLSVSADENGKKVDAIDRIGNGPWYDRRGRLLAPTLADLLNTRPLNGDPTIKNDLPNEDGIPNHRPDPNKSEEDNHHMLTGSGKNGRLYSANSTCKDWTSKSRNDGRPMSGFSWPRRMGGSGSSSHWISGFTCPGCEPGVDIHNFGGPKKGDVTVGGGGGYGGFYCFALNP
ncbi:MAG: carboxypeptidase-like regulatory domain-containing protein [Chitinispirillia bacterium]